MLAAPEFRPGTGLLAAVDAPGLGSEARQRWRVLTLDPANGAVRQELVVSDRAISRLDFDATVEHLLYIEGHAHPLGDTAKEASPVLFRWHEGVSRRVTAAPADATW